MKKYMLTLFIMLFVTLFTFNSQSAATADLTETKTDWIITGSESIQNKTIIIKGMLTIKPGANLDLQGVTLLMDGSLGILAEQGATISINNSKISPKNPGINFYPIVLNCDNAMIQNTEITGLGNSPQPYNNPLLITGKGSTVSNCKIGGAITLNNAKQCKLNNNKFYQESTPAKFYSMIDLFESNENELIGNTEYGGLNGIYCRYSWNNLINSNTWYAQEEKYIGSSSEEWWNETYVNGSVAGNGIWLNEMSNNNIVTNNKSFGASCSAYRITQSSANTLKNNYAKGTRVGLVMLFAQNNLIEDNQFFDIWEYEAIQMYRTHDNFIINNYAKNSQVGIALVNSKNETLSGNRFEDCSKALSIISSNNNNISGNSTLNCITTIVVDWAAKNTISSNNFVSSKRPSFICSDNIVSANYWTGPIAATDRLLDTAYSNKENTIQKAISPSIIPVDYIQRSTEALTINQDTVWENKSIELKGSLYIPKGVSLTLKNVTLIYMPDSNAVFHSVISSSGGNLYIYDSTLIGPEYDKLLNVSSKDADNFVLKNSKFYNMGAWDGGGATEVENVKNVDIQGNTFAGCYQASKIWACSNVVFSGNTIENVREGVSLSPINGSTVIIQNNKINKSAYHGIRIWACMGRLSKASSISGNRLSNIWGDGLWCSLDFLGTAVQKNIFENVRGPSVLSGDNLLLDGRSYRPIGTDSSVVKKGQSVNLYFSVMGVRRELLKTKDSLTDVQLTLNGKIIASKTLIIKSGKLNTINFSIKAPENGTYGLLFKNERTYK